MQDAKSAELVTICDAINREGHITVNVEAMAGGTFSQFSSAVEKCGITADTTTIYFRNPEKAHNTEEVSQSDIQSLIDATQGSNITMLRLNSWNLTSQHLEWLKPLLLSIEVLDLCDNRLGKEGILKAAEILKSNGKLRKALLYENGLMAKHRDDIVPVLDENNLKAKFQCFG